MDGDLEVIKTKVIHCMGGQRERTVVRMLLVV